MISFPFLLLFSLFSLAWKDVQDKPMIEIIKCSFFYFAFRFAFSGLLYLLLALLGFNPDHGRDGDRQRNGVRVDCMYIYRVQFRAD